jgi:hypothetical protein
MSVPAVAGAKHHVLVVVHLAFQSSTRMAGRGGDHDGVGVKMGGDVHGGMGGGRVAKGRRRDVGVQVMVMMRVGVEMGRGWEGRGRRVVRVPPVVELLLLLLLLLF